RPAVLGAAARGEGIGQGRAVEEADAGDVEVRVEGGVAVQSQVEDDRVLDQGVVLDVAVARGRIIAGRGDAVLEPVGARRALQIGSGEYVTGAEHAQPGR